MRRGHEIVPVVIGENGVTEADLIVHNEQDLVGVHAQLSRLRHPEFPEPIGVLRAVERPTYNDLVNDQVADAVEAKGGRPNLQKLVNGHSTWEVKED